MRYHDIDVSPERIAAFCRRNRIRRWGFFGSVLREDFGPQSDGDVLLEFEPGARTGLRFFAGEEELSRLLRRKADPNTPGLLSKRFRDQVLSEVEVLYDAT